MKISAIGASALLIFTPFQPAIAREWPSAGGWKVVENEKICYITNSYRAQGYYDITVIQNVDAPIAVLVIINSVWNSIELDKEYSVKVHTDDYYYEIDDAHGVNIAGKKGVSISLDQSFVEDFASSNVLTLYVGGTFALKAKLTGSSAAVVGLKRCLSAISDDKAAEEKRLAPYKGLPEDPFKKNNENLQEDQNKSIIDPNF